MRVEAHQADVALLQMLEWFPGGIEQEDGPEGVVLSGYAEQPPADGLTEQRRRGRVGDALARVPPSGAGGWSVDRSAVVCRRRRSRW